MDNYNVSNKGRPSTGNNKIIWRSKQNRSKVGTQAKKTVARGFYVNLIYCFVLLFSFLDVSRSLIVEARKLNVNRNTGETILHKAARLGYHVSITCTTLALFELFQFT